MVLEHHRRLALLAESSRQLHRAFVVEAQLQCHHWPSRTVRVDPERKAVEQSPVLTLELPPDSCIGPGAAVPWSRTTQSRGHLQPKRWASLARPLSRKRHLRD